MVQIEWLKGVRVILIGQYVPTPLAAYFLHQFGAEVIKVESGKGDVLRQMGVIDENTRGETSPMFRFLNGGFKSIGLQYQQPEGASLLIELLQSADVLLDGHRRGALQRYLGDELGQIAPNLIYAPISAYGQVGPMASLAGHDNNILALAGNLSYTQMNAGGLPSVFSAPLADIFAGQLAAMGILAALMHRQKTVDLSPKMQTIDASMLHAGFFLNMLELAARNDLQPNSPIASGAWMNGGRADYGTYRCADGKFIFFGLIENWSAKRFFGAIGRLDLSALLMDHAQLRIALESFFMERSCEAWVNAGLEHDACITAVNDLETAIMEPQIQSLGRMQTVNDPRHGAMELPSFPMGFGPESQALEVTLSGPLLGEHNSEIMEYLLGKSKHEVRTLYSKGILVESALLSRLKDEDSSTRKQDTPAEVTPDDCVI